MPRTLVVPGVSVEARFDVSPPLPARSGILGAVGVVDRIPAGGPQGVTTTQELFSLFGPATRYAFPEAVSALVNGVSEVVVSPVAPGTGQVGSATLFDDEGEAVAILRARAVGPWSDKLAVQVTRTLGADGRTVRRVAVEVLHDGKTIERHDGLLMKAGDDSDLFTVLNRDSGTIVAIDPVYATDLPVVDAGTGGLPLVDSGAQTATGRFVSGGGGLIDLAAAKPGATGNRISLEVTSGRATRTFTDGSNPSVRVLAEEKGAAGAAISVGFASDGAGGVDISVQGVASVRSYSGLKSVDAIVTALNADPDVLAQKLGSMLPADTSGRQPLVATVSVILREEGVRTTVFEDLGDADALVAALTADGAVVPTLIGAGTDLPDVDGDNAFFLFGGRDAGLARAYAGQNNPGATILELVPAPGTSGAEVLVRMGVAASGNGAVRLQVGTSVGGGFEVTETWDDLDMDPDSPGYLPAALEGSALVRAIDRYPRSRATHMPAATLRPVVFSGGAAPAIGAWQDAIDALALEDAVDLVMAGLQGWADSSLDHLAVQQGLLGHAIAQADKARPRIVIGSVGPDESADVAAIVDHSGQVRDRRFVLVTPAGAEGAMAGLLGHLTYFMSPTFKTVASPGVPLQVYRDSQLDKLVGSDGNVCVITQKKGRGTICVKGIATDGFQISVTRVADRCIREVKAIADRFIGELNNDDARNALKQMIVATFSQMERDGALVPSVDGESPAFIVDVYASQNDAASGIVRVDIAVRPVRAIDYVYATINVKN